jgi:PPP family 3-phenylpropionic acid transporter
MPSRPSLPTGLRLSIYYAAIFTIIGVYGPFWPVWLKSRGLDATEIGLLLAAVPWVRVVFTPMIATLVDRSGERRRPMILLATLAVAGFALFALAEGFWQLLAISLLYTFFFSPVMPLGENVTLLITRARGMDYGRIRLWGSITFIIAAMGTGKLLVHYPDAIVMWLVLGGLAATALACILIPDIRPPAAAASAAPLRHLLGRPNFLLFLFAAALIQASHSVYYGFSTLHWREAGHGDDLIGWLWAEGVIAEIILFALAKRLPDWLTPARMLALAAGAGILRWTVTGLTTDVSALLVVQALHAFTFGAAHLGAMAYIQRTVPAELSATAQSLYASVAMGAAFGLTMMVAGELFQIYAGGAFFAMTGMMLVGLIAALALERRSDRDGSPQAA